MSSLRLTSAECAIALQELTKALEATQEWIEQWVDNEDSAPIGPHNALPSNRRSIKFIQAVFKQNFSPSVISDAIDAVEELQFEVTRHREETESAFQHLWYLYNVQSFRTIQGHASVESLASVSTRFSVRTLASVSTRVSVRTLASISNRIAECLYAEDGGELMDDSSDPIQWLQEQALRADIHPRPISAHVLPDDEGEDATSEDDSSVRVGFSKYSILTEIMVYRMPQQLILPKFWRKIKCLLRQCWSKHRERQTQVMQVTLPPSINPPHSRLHLSTTNIW